MYRPALHYAPNRGLGRIVTLYEFTNPIAFTSEVENIEHDDDSSGRPADVDRDMRGYIGPIYLNHTS